MNLARLYIVGFALSLLLTLVAFWLVGQFLLPRGVLIMTLVTLAVAQFLVQLIFFLHLGREPKPHWNFMVFVFAIFIVAVLVGGSLWIMYNLKHSQESQLSQMFEGGEISPQTEK